ncbi:MAG: cyclophilin-like fold protein [Alistipes sp.]|nr:cyclophilin-like fold protein [Alistipes sp.]
MKHLLRLVLTVVLAVSVTACADRQADENPTLETTGVWTEAETTQTEQEENNIMKMNIKIGENVLTATLVQNSSTEALIELLSEGPVTINMSDYANMEKVGTLPQGLPRNDEQISTGAGDLILYQGNSFVIYYGNNSWSLTRLGKVDDVTQRELMDILGSGSVTAVLSLPAE